MANVTVPVAYTCTPSSLLNSVPCMACLSEKQMLAALLAIISLAESKTIPDLLDESACFTCMSKKQMLQGLVTVMGNDLLGRDFSDADVIARVKCLECASQKQILAALLYLFCQSVTFSIEALPT